MEHDFFESMKYKSIALLSLIVSQFILMTFMPFTGLHAQELNAAVKVNSAMVQGANRQVFGTLEEALRMFINGRRWTDNQLEMNERINCSFTFVITETPTSGSFKCELYVQSHRPVRNSGYITPMVNIHDKEVEFDYAAHQPLQFDLNFIQGNLTATVAYYAYLILGLDLDSRSSLGGVSCFRNMELIATVAQSYGWKGWDRRSNRNRSATTAAFNDGALAAYRQMWFDYHRALKVTSTNGEPQSEGIIPSLLVLLELQSKHPTSVLIKLFGDAKLEEMINLLSKADAPERKQAYELLLKLYPTRNTEVGRLG